MEKNVPVKMTITEANAGEIEVLADNLEPGRIYVKDRGYAGLALFQQILETGSSFVCRVKDNTVYECLEEFELIEGALAAGIVFDKKVRPGCNDKTKKQLSVPVRLIAVKCTPHKKRYKIGRGGPQQGEMLLIATDIFDLDADVIALIFKRRWAVEIFFRFFKHVLGCRHLLSYNRNGIELQTYAAIIACMLIALWTGRKPTLRTYEMLCWYFTGMADEEELLAHIARLQKQG
jgi:IS4 transposase